METAFPGADCQPKEDEYETQAGRFTYAAIQSQH